MTGGGWTMMLLSVGGISLLLGWCVYKVIATPGASAHMHSQADIKPHDRED